MRVTSYDRNGTSGVAVQRDSDWADLGPVDLVEVLNGAHADKVASAPAIDLATVTAAPPLARPGKIICVGLNYSDHTDESPYEQPDYPTLFPRFSTSLIADGAPIIRPLVSQDLDYEGELVAIIGKSARHVSKERALDHVAGYSIFNDGSLRDYQFKSPQWTVGKNFDDTGAFGPIAVSADELPAGAKGLRLQTRLNGKVVQDANTDDMIYSVADLISIISEAITLEPGDIIVTGTPAGIGMARDPKLYMKPGDVVEVEIEGIGILKNPIVDEKKAAAAAA
ncbi:fumarylacetoacetate hydrolase family protein [Paracoccus zhejiangensis]|uniref:5-oxopent-3-ene-1,2,5-tricarboxylate decarboxylase n=1 Tax=Paracoccus zhejiangensis TaxID=1077935 RepID=A0A2H5F525_9RHOB|nr:fumarylacetoacetate hydrolase family protein [Paracoccus zhejiangensis]AUH66651.1 5-oxopent-3-ene-1,2,5-tricarboxylate decarboxylase [Paracoccus zhejiangensis]